MPEMACSAPVYPIGNRVHIMSEMVYCGFLNMPIMVYCGFQNMSKMATEHTWYVLYMKVDITSSIFGTLRSNWIRFDGVLYKKPSATLVGVEEDLPVFAEVLDVFVYMLIV